MHLGLLTPSLNTVILAPTHKFDNANITKQLGNCDTHSGISQIISDTF